MRLFSELKRRNVLRMAALYLVSAWLIMQIAEVVIGLANLPDWVGPLILTLLAVGLPIALVLSWFYELTPEGITLDEDVADVAAIRHTRRGQIDIVIIAVLAAAVLLFAYDKWWPEGEIEKSIAVLAFDNMSDDPDQEYLSDGIAEELLNALAKIPELRVTSRSSSFSFKNQNVPISEMAEQLNVSHVLEGSVRKSGDRIRITAQLIDAASDKHLWSETYDREMTDLFVVQDDIAGRICDELRVRLARAYGEEISPAVVRSAELTAYDLYLQGREILRNRNHRRYQEAGELFLKALRIDPTFAEAHAQVAIAAALASERLDADEQEWVMDLAIENLAKAEALNPDFPEFHAAQGLLAMGTDDAAAIVHLERALELSPNYGDAMNWLRFAYEGVGRHEDAEQMLDRMLAVDPLSVLSLSIQYTELEARGEYEEAHAVADKLSVHGKARAYWVHAGMSLYGQGNLAEGLYWALKAGEELGDNYSYVAQALLIVHEFDEVRRLWGAYAEPYIASMQDRHDDVIRLLELDSAQPTDSPNLALNHAINFYNAGRFEDALPLFRQFFDSAPDGELPRQPLMGPTFEGVPVISLMRLAETYRRLGDDGGARETAEIAKRENASLRAEGEKTNNRDIAEAMIAAFERNHDAAITSLRAALGNGMRVSFHDDPLFNDLHSHSEFVAFAEEFEAILAREHAKVLQLICYENPTPNAWRPLPETCEGVTEKPGLLEFSR